MVNVVRKAILALVMCFCSSALMAQMTDYYTHPLNDSIRTLQVIVDDDFTRLPVVDLKGNSRLSIAFDFLATEVPHLCYRVVHCSQDWEESSMSELDYLEGFQPVRVDRVTPSFNTFTSYYHYQVDFPNENVRLKLSGNYAVLFHMEDDPDDIVAIATFGVSEQMAFVTGEVSGVTDVDYRSQHQQLNLELTWSSKQMPHLDPSRDVRIVVYQNNRRDTRRDLRAPSRMDREKAVYEHQRDLIFEGGNVYRRFEFIDERYASLGVDKVRYKAPFYHVMLMPDAAKVTKAYFYDKDQHGRYVIHALRVDDVATQGEYFYAHFSLEAPLKPQGQEIYLTGDFTYGNFDDEYQMQYDAATGLYHQEVLLKQGAYNYQYVVGNPMDEKRCMSTSMVEGNHYESKNEYEIYVYYRPFGARYDRLLGTAVINAK